ncbi:MAG: extracellular solute-binding protein [Acetatifactor sp.]|nr:extracellular solute-binding protein [Acetatifactor sp.]
MKSWKRAAVAALGLTVTLLLAACGSDKGTVASDDQAKQSVFREKEKTEQVSGIMTGDSNVAAMACYDNILYMVVNAYPEGGHTATLHTWDKEGNKLGETTVFKAESGGAESNGGVMPLDAARSNVEDVAVNDTDGTASSVTRNAWDFRITPQGNVCYTLYEYRTDEKGEITEKNYLKCMDQKGTELFTLDIKSLAEGEEDVAVQSVVFSSEGTFYLLAGQKIFEADAAGKILNKYDAPEGYTDLYGPAFYYKGEPVFTVWNYEGETTTVKSLIFDFKAGRVKQELSIPSNILSQYSIYPGMESGYDLILSNSTGLYGYRIGETEPAPVMNYIASDLPASGFENLCFLSKTEFIGSYYDIAESKSRAAWMEYVEPSKVPDRQVINLATYGLDYNLHKKIIDFNKTNPKYKILVTDYSTYATTEDYNAGITVLNNEMAAGRVPDIIYNTGNFDFRNYANKGMLTDFYELINADEEMKLEDYCTNVFKAYETDGRLYELAHDFYVETMVGKKSIFGDDTCLTWEKMNQILAQYPDANPFYNTATRDLVLSWAMRYSMDEFVDWQKSTCNFDSEGFRSLLTFVSKFPETIDYEKLYEDADAWSLQEQQFISNASLLNQFSIFNMNDIRNFTYSSFLEEVTPVGFPNNRGMGSSICAIGTFGIAEKSVHKQAAWEFVRQFILADQQMPKDNGYRWGLPVYKPALLELASRMTEKPFYIDSETGEKVYYDNTISVNGEEIVLEPATQEEAKRWVDFILSVDKRVSGAADSLQNIVNEEAAAYFNGQKSVEEVTKIIQSRMSIYISEND